MTSTTVTAPAAAPSRRAEVFHASVLILIALMLAALLGLVLMLNQQLAHLEHRSTANRSALQEANRRLEQAGLPTVHCPE